MDKPEKVTDIMTKRVIVLREEDNLARLSEGMERYHLRHLPVTSDDRLVGLITHRDLLRLTVSSLMADDPTEQDKQSKLFENTFVAEVMTPDPMTVNPDTPIKEAAKKLVETKYGCLPVVDEKQMLVGIVTEHDFINLLVDLLEED